MKIVVVGAGSWGTAFSWLLAEHGHDVTLACRDPDQARAIRATGRNPRYLRQVDLSEIAAVADLSQFHFARAFRKSTGQTPQQYLMQQRIERAKQLLSKDDLPIVEISLRTGFKNQSHFTTLFRKFTKHTPKLWREMKLA